MSQVLPTTAGSDYELSFWLRRTSFASAFLVRWEGQQVFGEFLTNPDFMEWKHFTVPLHSNITGSLLEFGQAYFPQEFHIDDISVVAVPAPGAAAVLVIGGAVVMRRRRR
jgi:MYXO-CTERM domain-containing protein